MRRLLLRRLARTEFSDSRSLQNTRHRTKPRWLRSMSFSSGCERRHLEAGRLFRKGALHSTRREPLVVAEATAVRHVANKLDMGSRAQVAVWAVGHGIAPTAIHRPT